MGGATISTGAISWRRDEADTGGAGGSDYLLLLADFSAAASRAATPTPRLQRVDRDTLDEVFGKLDVRLKLPFCDQPLHFTALEELHPDYLYDRVELFAQLRDLQRHLGNPNTFEATAAKLTAEEAPAAPSLDELLAATPNADTAPTLDISKLIHDIVAPYVVPAPSPQQTALQASVQRATEELMRKVLHQSGFRALEASWRGLDLLLRRIDGEREPRLFLVDSPAAYLPKLLSERGALEELLQRAGLLDTAPSLLVGDYRWGDSVTDLEGAAALAEFARRRHCVAVAGASERLAGCNDLHADPDDWQMPADTALTEAWRIFRGTPGAQHLVLIAPRFLLRSPYGRRTVTTDLDFEEWTADNPRTLLWGNGAWLAALAQCNGDDSIASLPLPPPGADEPRALCSAETLLNDRAALRLRAAGLTALRAERDSDRVYISDRVSCYLKP